MPVGLNATPTIAPVPGIRLAAGSARIAAGERNDVALVEASPGSQCAAVFTRNAFCAAPVTLSRTHLSAATPRYLLINAGNANCGTGQAGLKAAVDCCAAVAEQAQCSIQEVLPFSPGVIGEPLPSERIVELTPELVESLSDNAWLDAARAIMTTDTVPKGVTREVSTPLGSYVISGIAKGVGMICPNMATMLAYVATDAAVEVSVLQSALASAVSCSFNRVTVDGDTSTNDSCVVFATGQSEVSIDQVEGDDYLTFVDALTEVCVELGQMLIRDAEGATKFITINVSGGHDDDECAAVAYSIAHSPLVKTAFFASDANWGRLLMAIGRSGVEALDVDKVQVYLDEVQIVDNGVRAASYTEEAGAAVMAREEIAMRVELGRGAISTTVWTSDLSHDYVRVNAEYRT
ncbi:MAG: bifunctional ornithine acetyltransferase/N-acetylglutamate synthase [Thiotrichales bacterium]|nr:bifunctional ornithine acetyltransferase/N-acetylglutamate synthase [Thiotrichales bacterium]